LKNIFGKVDEETSQGVVNKYELIFSNLGIEKSGLDKVGCDALSRRMALRT
jgi:hypothetical protein